MIPFSPPHIDARIIDEVVTALKSGWITTGPRTKAFEKKLADFCHVQKVVCVSSASSGLELMLHWFGLGPGDEVIIPAYTYTATAEVVLHCGAKPVMVDVNPDFLISVQNIRKAITSKTKVIIPVDIAGLPCDYKAINQLVNEPAIKAMFVPANDLQRQLGRILVMSDSAHSLGAYYQGKRAGALTDITVFSFHAVKNLTTAEGGAIALNLPAPFNMDELYKELCIFSLHGQSKDALAKTKLGNWRYDVLCAGYKCNMTDIAAAIGLIEIDRYDSLILKRRKEIFDAYTKAFCTDDRFEIPEYQNGEKTSSFHVYPLRIKNITEATRDKIMEKIFEQEVAVNVHFIPLAMLTCYKNLGYKISDYPVTYDNYAREISLPVYFDLTEAQVQVVIEAVKNAVDQCLS